MQIELGKPEQFCTPMVEVGNDSNAECRLCVAAYPVAWRVEVVNDDIHRGYEYIRSEHNFTRPTGTVY